MVLWMYLLSSILVLRNENQGLFFYFPWSEENIF
uniref:Uncharacterized protein n=1 Tax=Arundo donax TaxID=35708 RepID=A0A0A9BJ83_ARUDO